MARHRKTEEFSPWTKASDPQTSPLPFQEQKRATTLCRCPVILYRILINSVQSPDRHHQIYPPD